MASTTKELVEILTERNTHGKYDKLIADAKAGKFHDFKSDEATPKTILAHELHKFKDLEDLADRVMEGEFDEDLNTE
jgi:hypothetical protein